MKKLSLIFLATVIILTFFACEKIDQKNSDKKNIEAVSENIEETQKSDNSKDSSDNKSQTDKNLETADSKTEDDRDGESDSENSSQQEDTPAINHSEDEAGKQMFNKAVDMYTTVMLSCPFDLDYSNTNAEGFPVISDSSVTSIEDIENYYCKVFAEPDSYIRERYREIDGKVYCSDASRGANIYYTGTDLELVSQNSDEILFNAISHYSDPETGESLEDKISEFAMVLTDAGYRVTQFEYPQ